MPQTYGTYELVEHTIQPEERFTWVVIGYTLIRRRQTRSVETKIWEAWLHDGEGNPGQQNPGGLASPWKCESISWSRTKCQPLSTRVREAWSQTTEWTTVETETIISNS